MRGSFRPSVSSARPRPRSKSSIAAGSIPEYSPFTDGGGWVGWGWAGARLSSAPEAAGDGCGLPDGLGCGEGLGTDEGLSAEREPGTGTGAASGDGLGDG
ncbi:hypothetical protein GCM10018953_34000 [Streptosporangium nondiastaticum]